MLVTPHFLCSSRRLRDWKLVWCLRSAQTKSSGALARPLGRAPAFYVTPAKPISRPKRSGFISANYRVRTLGNLYQWHGTSLFANAATSARFRQVVLQHDECLPLVAVGIMYPSLVRNRVTAIGLHLVMRRQAAIVPLLLHCQ